VSPNLNYLHPDKEGRLANRPNQEDPNVFNPFLNDKVPQEEKIQKKDVM
jgi:hypothetical protein